MCFLRTHARLMSLSRLQLTPLAAPPLSRSAAIEQATKPKALITALAMGGKANGLNDAGGESVGRVSHHAGFCSTFFNEKPAIERSLGIHKKGEFRLITALNREYLNRGENSGRRTVARQNGFPTRHP